MNRSAAMTLSLMPHRCTDKEDVRLRLLLRRTLLLGVLAVLLIPAARGYSAWLGWWPLWLVGMPLSALLALPRPGGAYRRRKASGAVRGRRAGQARRWTQRAAWLRLPRAA